MRTCACGCGRELRRARADAIYATGGCRQRAYKGRQRADVPTGPVPQYEPDVVAFVAAGELDFLDALDWLTDPAGARDRYLEAAVA